MAIKSLFSLSGSNPPQIRVSFSSPQNTSQGRETFSLLLLSMDLLSSGTTDYKIITLRTIIYIKDFLCNVMYYNEKTFYIIFIQ